MYSMYTYIREFNRNRERKRERVKRGRRSQITVTVLSPKAKVILQTTRRRGPTLPTRVARPWTKCSYLLVGRSSEWQLRALEYRASPANLDRREKETGVYERKEIQTN